MIRIEKTVQMLRCLQDTVLYSNPNARVRADQHTLKRIDSGKLFEMFQEDMSAIIKPHSVETLKTRLQGALEQNVRIQQKEECECYTLANQGGFFNPLALKEKFYFIHNPVLRRTVILKYTEDRY